MKNRRIKVIVGHYGSGKTEFALSYCLELKKTYEKVAIVDLDVVNPYFRSREWSDLLTQKNIELLGFIIKEEGMDLPAVSGNLMKPINDPSYQCVIDLGGNGGGARAFSSFRNRIDPEQCEVLLVLNANRPETSDLKGAINVIEEIENTLDLKITGIVNNTHLIWETTKEDVLCGDKLAKEVSIKTGIPIRYTVAKREILEEVFQEVSGDLFPLDIIKRKNWL
jgi:hypothetical protein